jgi:hypothetical protein
MSRENAATTSEVSTGVWGRSFTLIKLAIETIPSLTVTSARVGIAALPGADR